MPFRSVITTRKSTARTYAKSQSFPCLYLKPERYRRLTAAVSYGGEVLDAKTIMSGNWSSLNMPAFRERNSKENRRGEIFSAARELRTSFTRVGSIGFCFGGWAVFELGAAEFNGAGTKLVDCVATAHPSWVTKEEIDALGVPIQIQAPETDPMFRPDLKEYANQVIPTLGVPYEYLYFPGTAHGFATRGDTMDVLSKQAMERSMSAAVYWFKFWLKSTDDNSMTVQAGASK